MGVEKNLFLISIFTSLVYNGNGCQMEGVGTWLLTQEVQILDTYRGTFWNRTTTSIDSMTSITVGGSVNYANYLDILWEANGYFTISTSSGYELYEENETSEFISFTVNFACSGGTSSSLIFSIRVQDTNNNPPIFRPSDQYEFTITPPLPPGFQITGCVGDDIVVRDIDLTTSRIDFTIEDNPYFEISYEGRSSTDPKEFHASLTTKDLIRSLSEDLELIISATDVDATQDPRITTYATIRVKADEEFLFPEEPVFTQPFYTATYTNNQVVLDEVISLQQGYDDEVTFSLDGEYSNYFGLVVDGNAISIEVSTSLSNEVLQSGRIILVVKAEREYTSGTTATVIIQLPEVLSLEFEQAQYTGRIVDNTLEPLQLTLIEGYEEGFDINLQNEYSSYFSTSVQGNVITLSMPTSLPSTIIDENNFISLQVIASNELTTATTVVTLDIVKDDNVTPAFEKAIYTGDYDPNTGLVIEQIRLEQGYDQTLSFSLEGEHSEYFSTTNDGPVLTLTLTSSGIPTEIWMEHLLLLTVSASKPRTVTATATISITLPSARQLAFEAPTYAGTLQDNILNIGTVVLSVGFTEDVDFTLIGGYASYFTVHPVQNEVTIVLSTPLPEAVISEINFLTLTLSASGLHAVSTSTTILLEITKQDSTTPVFTENIYAGSYTSANSIEIGNISLAQGYDSSVTFNLDGEHAQYFEIAYDENNLNLVLVSDIPSEVIFRDKVLLFNILAEKALTVGANAAISITFPQELTDATVMRFSQNTYIGSVEDNTLVLENIILETGYETGTEFSLSGEYSAYFELQNISNNVLNILIQNQLSPEILENNEFIILEVNASRERAVSVSSSIVIALEKKEVVPPVFSDAYYKSVYADGNLENLVITLSEGYDDTVTFELQGDNSVWFSITNVGNIVQLELNTSNSIPDDVLENNDYFLFSIVANKPDTVNAEAAIFIHLPKEITEAVIVRFSQSSYVGRIDNGELYAPVIELLGEREPISFTITGDYAEFFEASQVSPSNVELRLRNGSLPEIINELPFIIIDIEAQYPEAISGQTTVILEIVKEPGIVTPVFDQAYYIGEYSEQGGLQFEQTIRLSQGFDDSVVFTLAGDDAQWFELNNTAQNSLTLVVNDSGLEQIRDRSHLVFSVVANKIGSIAGHAAIIIGLSDALGIISLRFERDYYVGFIENNYLSINDLNMVEGYSPEINISFTGDHAEYFQLTNQEGIFTLQVLSELPADVIEDNNVLVFTLEAQAGNARTHTTIVLELIKTQQLGALAFEEIYYVGLYSIIDGFTFDPQITLTEGYDETVSFSLEGDDAHWFDIVENQYPLVLTQTLPIPNEVVSLSQQLIFVVLAEKPGSSPARSTIIVPITDDTTVLEFERNVYLGSIQESDGTATIDTIVLSAGYSANVSFNLFGDLESYFTITEQGVSVTVSVQTNIPSELIPNNGIIQLELQASAPQAISANTTLIYGIVRNDVASIQFSEIYYTGRYSDLYGLDFRNNVTLTAGYDDSVQFNLEGDDSQYFQTVILENSVSLVIASTIPTELIINRRPLIFTIRANKTDSSSALATIVIELVNELQTTVLRFDQISYLGSMENNTVNLESVILSEGYTQNVSFNLQGDLNSYFSVSNEEAIVTISLETPIPQDLIQDNRIIILELLAYASNAMSAHTAIVIEVIQEEILPALDQLVFSEAYYTGHYTEADGLTFSDTIILVEGFDENVTFALEGDSSQYFEAVNTDNSVTLRLTTPIPSAVVMNNPHLIFTIRADKLDAMTGRATVVIALLDEYIEDMVLLGFDRITYTGSLENDSLTLDQITLSEGYSTVVSFTLFGDLENYFVLTSDGATISITLRNPIPEQLIPDNRIIILEIEASAIGTMSAHAVIVIEVVQENVTPALDQLVFSEAYYTGRYTEADGLTFSDTIILVEGFDENVTFALEGDSSQYFEAVITDNSVMLRLTTPIPSAVVMNNPHLIFTIRADKLDVMTGRATVVIALLDEFNEDMVLLGFDSITYIGYLENNSLTLDQITLSEGYSTAVSFTLFGDLENYFVLTSDGATISITLRNPIPEQLIPDNRIIILEIEASATGTMSAHAIIVIEVVPEEITPTLDQLLFSGAYYTGHYTETDGLTFADAIILIDGYDENVTFALEEDSAQYFEAVITDNSVTLRLITPIPSAVVMNNHHLIFTIRADKPEAMPGRATIVIALLDEYIDDTEFLGFDRITYLGSLENGSLYLDQITLSEGYSESVSLRLFGDLESYFALTSDGAAITITLRNSIPEQLIPDNRIIILEIEVSATGFVSAHAAIVIEAVQENITPTLDQLVFSEFYYTGHYTESDGLMFSDTIILIEGFDENTTFALEGDSSQYFEAVITDNSVTLRVTTPIPSAVVINNHHLIFTVSANKPNANTGMATIVIALLDEYSEDMALLGFDRIYYVGTLEDDNLYLDQITLSEGYSTAVSFTLHGTLNGYFTLISEGASMTITLNSSIPAELIPENSLIILGLEASAPDTLSAHATLVVKVVQEENSDLDRMSFSEAYYTGHYSELEGLTFEDVITLSEGYNNNVTFTLEGDDSQYFEVVVVSENSISLRMINPIPSATVTNNQQLIFTIRASAPNTTPARATIVISLHDDYSENTPVLGFNRINYIGSIEGDSANIETIILSEGYSSNVEFTLHGDLQNYFSLTRNEAIVTVSLNSTIPEELIPSHQIIVLEIQASAPDTVSAYATVVFKVIRYDSKGIAFNEPYYTGYYSVEEGLTFDATISTHGYDESVQFSLEGDHSQWFQLTVLGNSVSLSLANFIPDDVLASNRKLIFVIVAQKSEISTRATIIISLINEAVCSDALFGKVLYEGIVQSGEVQHEIISISGYEGTDIQLYGEHAELFSASLSEGVVTVQAPGPVTLSPDDSYVALELRAGTASAVLLLDVVHTENPELPSVSFSSSSYSLQTDVTHTGLVGRVLASADNGEAVVYSLAIDNTHLLERIYISDEGELYLWAPVNSGVYIFQVLATTVFSRVTGTATIRLNVEAITIWGDDDYVLPPLQILDRDEESPHENIVPFNASAFEGCGYILSNRWPADQSWLYVDETGLHAHAIDREHDSIALMALSQIQVELILQCDSDNESIRSKRSVNLGFRTDQLEHLGPYDYGNSKWIITDSINYNPRRTLVNLIVNDINDNYPIFIGKDNEPIVVGYPEPDLEERILPRALVEVQATDADVGENAALVYWSTEEVLAVSPTTGSVHVRDIAGLESDAIVTVFATDRNGQGLTGSLDLLVKLVNTSHIAVVTIRNAFLDNEKDILTNLTAALGYEIKALKSSVISTESEEIDSRKKREAIVSSGSSLQLYVYGLVEREPVDVERLTEDINTSAIETVTIASTVSLEDHLENLVICPLPGRDTALFVSTIVLAVLLFILIVAAAVWYFLKWRKKQNYEEFSDENSIASRDDPLPSVTMPKPEQPAPRMNIEDLKRSERRLQEMLHAPLDTAPQPTPVPQTSEKPIESKVNIPDLPIVIQSFDKLKDADESDEDEFGERKKNRRKSVVTFNENVEKIIHVDPPDDSDLEVFRL